MKVELNENTIEGKRLITFLSSTQKRNIAIYLTFINYRESGKNVTDSVLYVADDFNISESTVYRIVKKFSESAL